MSACELYSRLNIYENEKKYVKLARVTYRRPRFHVTQCTLNAHAFLSGKFSMSVVVFAYTNCPFTC